jgi:hypothetical protein
LEPVQHPHSGTPRTQLRSREQSVSTTRTTDSASNSTQVNSLITIAISNILSLQARYNAAESIWAAWTVGSIRAEIIQFSFNRRKTPELVGVIGLIDSGFLEQRTRSALFQQTRSSIRKRPTVFNKLDFFVLVSFVNKCLRVGAVWLDIHGQIHIHDG